MSEERGLGAEPPLPELPALYKAVGPEICWPTYCQVRPLAWPLILIGWGPVFVLSARFGESEHWLALANAGLFFTLLMFAAIRREFPQSKVAVGGALKGWLLLAGSCVAISAVQPETPTDTPAILSLALFCGSAWLFQFYPVVCSVEPNGFVNDLKRSAALLGGHHLQSLLMYVTVYFMALCLLVPVMMATFVLGKLPPEPILIYLALAFYIELLSFYLALYLKLYQELRLRGHH